MGQTQVPPGNGGGRRRTGLRGKIKRIKEGCLEERGERPREKCKVYGDKKRKVTEAAEGTCTLLNCRCNGNPEIGVGETRRRKNWEGRRGPG